MIKIKIGSGAGKIGVIYQVSFVRQSAELSSKHKKATIQQIGETLAKQLKIKNGTLEMHSIEFTFERETDEVYQATKNKKAR